jgi:hypothetical protein
MSPDRLSNLCNFVPSYLPCTTTIVALFDERQVQHKVFDLSQIYHYRLGNNTSLLEVTPSET